ncbi:hypothetical protein ATY81_24210 [Rhizobium sp. R72]|nr:hypothetical protein ATY79_27960 [Rhizobium sp. R693]OWW01548.1 hypothetical protein ATY81_24210 [Rhizobium sp. R72]OWW01636.1 hypothetical protein ATY80_24210 [Rhizobium sp. R711]
MCAVTYSGRDRQALVASHEAGEFLPADNDTRGCFGGVRMGIGQARQFRQFKGLAHVHDTDCLAAVDPINTDFDYKMRFLVLHE